MTIRFCSRPALAALAALALALPASAQQASTPISAFDLGDGLSMLIGAGGNILISQGPDGTLMIDNQYDYQEAEIRKALADAGASDPRFVINTHFHGDHTGGNAAFAVAGTVFAHDNVRVRLAERDVDAAALPLITYPDQIVLHVNGQTVEAIHVPRGHTDGDTMVFFSEADVVHLGDHFFNGRFPFVDLSSGGSVDGFLSNLYWALERISEDTQIVPGHGALARQADLLATIEMITDTYEIVSRQVASGSSLDDIVQQGLPAKYADWGAGFINEERWIRTLVADLRASLGMNDDA